jgi:cytochrome c oxidase subunit 1
VYPEEFQVLNVLSTAGALILGIGYLFPSFYLVQSMLRGEAAGPNPWHARGLEWETSSPPPAHNFDRTPVVEDEAYAYDKAPKETVVA